MMQQEQLLANHKLERNSVSSITSSVLVKVLVWLWHLIPEDTEKNCRVVIFAAASEEVH